MLAPVLRLYASICASYASTDAECCPMQSAVCVTSSHLALTLCLRCWVHIMPPPLILLIPFPELLGFLEEWPVARLGPSVLQ